MLEQDKGKINFDILEGIRGIASLYVCIAHCRGVLWIGGRHYSAIHPQSDWSVFDYLLMGFNVLTRLSTEFVIVFFILSGFSIAHSLRNNPSVKDFLQRRFIRLYPPYLMAIFWAGVVLLFIQTLQPEFFTGAFNTPQFQRLKSSADYFQPWVMIKNLIYLPQQYGIIHPLWSLTQEVLFYLLAPFMLRYRMIYYLGSSLLYVYGMQFPKLDLSALGILEKYLYVFNFYFMIGVFLYDQYGRISIIFNTFKKKYMWPILILTFLCTLAANLIQIGSSNTTYLLSGILGCLFIVLFLKFNIKSPILLFIGKFSYSLYITHFATIYLYMSLLYYFTTLQPPYIYNNYIFIPSIGCCIIVAYLSYYFIERKTKEILQRLRVKSEKEIK